MNRLIVLLLLYVLVSPLLWSQSDNNRYAAGTLSAEPAERISLFTDRSFYCAGEKIYFMADYLCIDEISNLDWSTVLYVELIRWNGEKIARGKYPLSKEGSAGTIMIPDFINSGNYYLRAYTKWMRNYSSNDYAIIPLKILNPFNSKTEGAPSNIENMDTTSKFASMERVEEISLKTSKNIYSQREEVKLKISFSGKIARDDQVIVAIAKTGSVDTSFPVIAWDRHERDLDNDIEYLPEIRGMTISGKIVNRETGEPVAKAEVNLSATESGVYFSMYETNDIGRFLFTLPLIFGKQDFYIDAVKSDSIKIEILIDSDYCNNPVELPYTPFVLTPEELALGRDMALNIQIAERFSTDGMMESQSQMTKKQPVFYGHADQVIYSKDFIELPNLEEFFIELVPGINVGYEKRKPYLRIIKPERFFSNPILILMDNIPVANGEALLKTEANRIERVEVIPRGFAKADQLYFGLISIYSKNKDYAGLDLLENSLFFSYDLYAEESGSDELTLHNWENDRIPDRRNLLYWESGVSLSSGEANILFRTSDNVGEYIVTARSPNGKGKPLVYGTCRFRVE